MTKARLDQLAPVAVYTYTRHEHLIQTLTALKQNHLAPHTVLYVVSDGASVPSHEPAVKKIRDFVDDLTGFREIVRVYRDRNLGLRVSVPQGEHEILADHGRIISMEDDNISSTNYLDFINAGLQYFEADESVFSICGYCPPVGAPTQDEDNDFWFYPWNLSWGYGLWKKKHDRFYPLKNEYPMLQRSGKLRQQNRAGGLYISDSLRRDFKYQKYFPDATLCTNMFTNGMQAVVPVRSKILNIGQDGSGQSTQRTTAKYDVTLDDTRQRDFNFASESRHATQYRKAAKAFYNGSRLTRVARWLGIYHELSELRTRLALNSQRG